jgi:hypothetical protein
MLATNSWMDKVTEMLFSATGARSAEKQTLIIAISIPGVILGTNDAMW